MAGNVFVRRNAHYWPNYEAQLTRMSVSFGENRLSITFFAFFEFLPQFHHSISDCLDPRGGGFAYPLHSNANMTYR